MSESAIDYDDLLELVVEIEASGGPDDVKDKRFLEGQMERIEKYRSKVVMTEQQVTWLRDIHKRCCG